MPRAETVRSDHSQSEHSGAEECQEVFGVHISTAYLHYCLVAMQCLILILFSYIISINTIYLFMKSRSGLQIFFPNIGRITMGFVFIFGPIRYSGRSHDVKHFLVHNVTLQNLKSRFSPLIRQHITGVFRNLHFGRSF